MYFLSKYLLRTLTGPQHLVTTSSVWW